jgi:hypothetical protein
MCEEEALMRALGKLFAFGLALFLLHMFYLSFGSIMFILLLAGIVLYKILPDATLPILCLILLAFLVKADALSEIPSLIETMIVVVPLFIVLALIWEWAANRLKKDK